MVNQVKSGQTKQAQDHQDQNVQKGLLLESLFHVRQKSGKAEDLEGERKETRITQNRHMENPPKIQIWERILPM